MTKSTARINVPSPAARPGDKPSFKTRLPAPGETPRPDPLGDGNDMRDIPFGLIRVLGDDHVATGDWNPHLTPDQMREGLTTMVRTRAMDERMLKMQRTKRLSFYMKSLGEEATSVAAVMALDFEDMLFPSYRQQGGFLQRGATLEDMMCQCISNAKDPLKGRQLPVHYTSKALNWFSISGNLGTQFPQAVGWSMASAAKGDSAIACSWAGDGTTAEGDYHAALTLASTYQTPTVLCVTNNQWGISSSEVIARGQAATFAAKAIGYGLPGLRVDGNDFLAVYAATQWAATRARAGHGATLIEFYTYRAEAHSTSDDPSKYRPSDEADAWPLGDPVERLKEHLIAPGEWSEAQQDALEAEAKTDVAAAWKAALSHRTLEEGPHAPVQTMFDDVFASQPWHLRRQRQALGV